VVDPPVELPEAPVHGLDEAGQAPVDVGVALRELHGELLAGGGAQLVKLLPEPDGERREGGQDEDDNEHDHGPTNARERVGRQASERGEAAWEPPLYLLRLFVRVLAGRVIVPGVRVEILGRAGVIPAGLHARGSTGGLARVLLVSA
jgi:hypothetical protein